MEAWGEEARDQEVPLAARAAVVWGLCQAGMAGEWAEMEPQAVWETAAAREARAAAAREQPAIRPQSPPH